MANSVKHLLKVHDLLIPSNRECEVLFLYTRIDAMYVDSLKRGLNNLRARRAGGAVGREGRRGGKTETMPGSARVFKRVILFTPSKHGNLESLEFILGRWSDTSWHISIKVK